MIHPADFHNPVAGKMWAILMGQGRPLTITVEIIPGASHDEVPVDRNRNHTFQRRRGRYEQH